MLEDLRSRMNAARLYYRAAITGPFSFMGRQPMHLIIEIPVTLDKPYIFIISIVKAIVII
ncbi:MAG: hypothetical protein A2Z19_01360 [Deltaproteobacteria bacterium RBG_16_54_18]|nr:MAG: hypothetical protein A2Z19_01360 [Deltaproteobacteria bacterium RBG_16_54_18]